ncbi:hypothetical protein M3Y99_00029300 [Aphelenchoides fujianensis]|nr:hypothetical protein M3Y99_00029300 [Aphelenchoides fujianensis]
MSENSKFSDLLGTASFAFGHLADLCRDLNDPLIQSGGDVRQRVAQFANELATAPKMRISYTNPRSFQPRRPIINRPSLVIDGGRKAQSDVFRGLPTTVGGAKLATVKSEAASPAAFRKRASDEADVVVGAKQMKGFKWVPANGGEEPKPKPPPAAAPRSNESIVWRSVKQEPLDSSEFHQPRDHNNNLTLNPQPKAPAARQPTARRLSVGRPTHELFDLQDPSLITEADFAVASLLNNWAQREDSDSELFF